MLRVAVFISALIVVPSSRRLSSRARRMRGKSWTRSIARCSSGRPTRQPRSGSIV